MDASHLRHGCLGSPAGAQCRASARGRHALPRNELLAVWRSALPSPIPFHIGALRPQLMRRLRARAHARRRPARRARACRGRVAGRAGAPPPPPRGEAEATPGPRDSYRSLPQNFSAIEKGKFFFDRNLSLRMPNKQVTCSNGYMLAQLAIPIFRNRPKPTLNLGNVYCPLIKDQPAAIHRLPAPTPLSVISYKLGGFQ